jgi:hypothetical protein
MRSGRARAVGLPFAFAAPKALAMLTYRCYLLNYSDRIVSVDSVQAEEDDIAMVMAASLLTQQHPTSASDGSLGAKGDASAGSKTTGLTSGPCARCSWRATPSRRRSATSRHSEFGNRSMDQQVDHDCSYRSFFGGHLDSRNRVLDAGRVGIVNAMP